MGKASMTVELVKRGARNGEDCPVRAAGRRGRWRRWRRIAATTLGNEGVGYPSVAAGILNVDPGISIIGVVLRVSEVLH